MAVNQTECYWKRATTLVSVSEKLDVVEARTLLRFQHLHEAEHQLQLPKTPAINTVPPPPLLVIHNFIVRHKAFPQTVVHSLRNSISAVPADVRFQSSRQDRNFTSTC